jgi:nucleotide-binding universal stress UspA family protein
MSKSLSTATLGALQSGSSIDARSQNVLVTLTGTEIDHRLVREAGTYAAGTGGQLVLLSVMPSREFADRQRVFAQIRDLPRYTLPKAEEKRRQIAAQIGREALDPLGIDYIAIGLVGRTADQVLTAAQAHNCGHVFLVDQTQSVLRRLIEGNLVQTVTQRFDGLVTVLRDKNIENSTIERTPSTV